MGNINLFFDACYLLTGIIATTFVLINRKRFDLWSGLLTCGAWVIYGVRRLGYDWYLISLKSMLEDGSQNAVSLYIQNATVFMQKIDTFVFILLVVALVRIVIKGLFWHWYSKAKKELGI